MTRFKYQSKYQSKYKSKLIGTSIGCVSFSDPHWLSTAGGAFKRLTFLLHLISCSILSSYLLGEYILKKSHL